MGDVRIPALATVIAAAVAVVGSIGAVLINGKLQRRLQASAFAEERSRSARSAEVDACVRFEAAVVLVVAWLQRVVDLADRPRMRRRLLGRDWTRRWEQGVQDALAEVRLPYLTVRLTARPPVRAAVETVMTALGEMSDAVASIPPHVPPPPAARWALRRWRDRIEQSRTAVQHARQGLTAALEEASAEQ
jgi:hypothetical protein